MANNNYTQQLDEACAKFRRILEGQLTRVENMKAQGDFTNYEELETIKNAPEAVLADVF